MSVNHSSAKECASWWRGGRRRKAEESIGARRQGVFEPCRLADCRYEEKRRGAYGGNYQKENPLFALGNAMEELFFAPGSR